MFRSKLFNQGNFSSHLTRFVKLHLSDFEETFLRPTHPVVNICEGDTSLKGAY